MKKTWKKGLVAILIAILCLTYVGGANFTQVEAAKKVAVKKVKLNKSSVTITVGKKVTLRATITPSKATNKSVTWKSSNKKVATVTSKGVVKGIKAGKATITVTSKSNKKLKATCKITVKKSTSKKVKSKEKVYDCEADGHGYYVIHYTDGTVSYQDF